MAWCRRQHTINWANFDPDIYIYVAIWRHYSLCVKLDNLHHKQNEAWTKWQHFEENKCIFMNFSVLHFGEKKWVMPATKNAIKNKASTGQYNGLVSCRWRAISWTKDNPCNDDQYYVYLCVSWMFCFLRCHVLSINWREWLTRTVCPTLILMNPRSLVTLYDDIEHGCITNLGDQQPRNHNQNTRSKDIQVHWRIYASPSLNGLTNTSFSNIPNVIL